MGVSQEDRRFQSQRILWNFGNYGDGVSGCRLSTSSFRRDGCRMRSSLLKRLTKLIMKLRGWETTSAQCAVGRWGFWSISRGGCNSHNIISYRYWTQVPHSFLTCLGILTQSGFNHAELQHFADMPNIADATKADSIVQEQQLHISARFRQKSGISQDSGNWDVI